ncbi:DEAD/DEAH box helicase [Parenemella sanctibonifatiensis]|nr:DEAD/DEAH box helicase [Parenemella sanctibonifatiensis]
MAPHRPQPYDPDPYGRSYDPQAALRRMYAETGERTFEKWPQAAEIAATMSEPVVSGDPWSGVLRFPREGVELDVPALYGRAPTRCSCGVKGCDHRLVAQWWLAQGPLSKDWMPTARQILESRRATPTTVPLALVLQIEPRTGFVALRPGLRTQKGTWNKQLGWHHVAEGYRNKQFEPEQVSAVGALLGRWMNATEVPLEVVGQRWWESLPRIREAGVVIAAEDVWGDHVDLDIRAEAPVEIHARLRREEKLLLDTATTVPWSADRLMLVGTPPTSCVAYEGELLIVAPVVGDDLALQLVDEPLEIPADDEAVFSEQWIPSLRTLGSLLVEADPTDEPLRLGAILTGRGADGAVLAWQWAQGESRRPLHGPIRNGRDVMVEHAFLERIQAEHPDLAGWLKPGEHDLDPVEACRFGLDIEPILNAHPDLFLDSRGDVLDYQPAEPEIVWEANDRKDRDWFDLALEVEVDGVPVEMGLLIAALATGEELLVLDDGQYIDLQTATMQRLRDLLGEAASLEGSGEARVSRYRIDWWERLQELAEPRRTGDQWRQQVGSLVVPDHRELALPDGVKADLRPYQLDGFRWLSQRWDAAMGGILADDMGLGKTLQVLAAIQRQRDRAEAAGGGAHGGGPTLILAPASVLQNWRDQAAQWTPQLRVRIIDSRLRDPLQVDDVDVVVTSHTLARLDEERYAAIHWHGVVIDEAQAARNPRTRLHRALRGLDRDFTLAVTGTPVENGVGDVWALMELVAPGALPPSKEFGEEFRSPIEKQGPQATEAMTRLRRRLRPFLLRRTKEEVATDLPERTEQVVTIELPPAEAQAYRKRLDHERQVVMGLIGEEGQHQIEILASLSRLRKEAASMGEPERPSEKSTFVQERVAELRAEGHRVLIFSQYTSHLRILQAQLEAVGISSEYLDGGTRKRGAVIERFRSGTADVFLISLKAGGVGITLTEADYVFLLDPWWNPAAESQAIDRSHRIGQTRPVHVYRLVAAQTVEEKVVALQEQKRGVASGVLTDDGTADLLDPDVVRQLLLED